MFKPLVIAPTCATCDGKFKPKSKTTCGLCGDKIHKKCGVYETDKSDEMICVDCFKQTRITKELITKGIITEKGVKVIGDDDVRCYIGEHFYKQHLNQTESLKIGEEITDCIESYDDDVCPHCGWRSEFTDSHIEYGNFKCKYITDAYDLQISEDGEILWRYKQNEEDKS